MLGAGPANVAAAKSALAAFPGGMQVGGEEGSTCICSSADSPVSAPKATNSILNFTLNCLLRRWHQCRKRKGISGRRRQSRDSHQLRFPGWKA